MRLIRKIERGRDRYDAMKNGQLSQKVNWETDLERKHTHTGLSLEIHLSE